MFDIISAVKGDPGFVEDVECYEVYLNKKLLTNCQSADVLLGEAVCYKLDKNNEGLWLLEDDDIATEVLYGEIKIIRIPDCKPRVNLKRKDFPNG